MMYKIYFSPTGGTKKVIDILAKELSKEIVNVDLIKNKDSLKKLKLTKSDVCVFGFPSYGGRIPSVCRDMLNSINGNGAKAIMVAVYGNRHIDDTLMEIYDLLIPNNFKVVAAVEAVAEHSLARIYGANRPDEEDEKDLYNFAQIIKDNLDTNILLESNVPGKHEYRSFNGVPFKPVTSEKCVNCKLCAKECPAQAIDFNNPKLLDPTKCISCMHCISICPVKAKSLSEEMQQAANIKLEKACGGERKTNKLYI